MGDCKHGEYQPQDGTWTLTAPDGRKWQAASGLLAATKEQMERIPPEVQLARIYAGMEPSDDELDAARLRWLTEDHEDQATRDKCWQILRRIPVMSHSAACAAIDAAMKTPNVMCTPNGVQLNHQQTD